MTTPIILAIDPGTARAGYCLAQGDRYIDSGTLVLGSGDWLTRMAYFAVQLQGMLVEFDPDLVACEEPRGDRGNRDTDLKIHAAFGVVLGAAAVVGVEFLPVNPATVKATQFSKDTPGMVAGLIGVALDELEQQPDRCDAIGVWQAGVSELRRRGWDALAAIGAR